MAQTDVKQTEIEQLKKEVRELSKDYLDDATHAMIADFMHALEASTAAKYNLQWCKLDPVVAGRVYKEVQRRSLEEPIEIHELMDVWKTVEGAE
jgi:hypothetical protein